MSNVYKFSSNEGVESEATCSNLEVKSLLVQDVDDKNPIYGPEHIEVSPTGDLYVGSIKTGELWMLSPNTDHGPDEFVTSWRATLVTKLTRALGIKSILITKVSDTKFIETLLVCDTMQGLQEVKVHRFYNQDTDSFEIETAEARNILTEVDGKTINFANAVTVAERSDGHFIVLLSDSTKDSSYQLMVELLSPPSGRIVSFDYTEFCASGQPNANAQAVCVRDKLSFVNGLHVLSCTENGDIRVLYVETTTGTVGVLRWNMNANRCSLETKWTGSLFFDNVVPSSPRWPKGTDLLSAVSPRCNNYISKFTRVPQSHFLIAAPAKMTMKVNALITTSKILRGAFSWVPGFPSAFAPTAMSSAMSAQMPPGAIVLYDAATNHFQTVYASTDSSTDNLGGISHACIADVIDDGMTLRILIISGSFEIAKQLHYSTTEIKKEL